MTVSPPNARFGCAVQLTRDAQESSAGAGFDRGDHGHWHSAYGAFFGSARSAIDSPLAPAPLQLFLGALGHQVPENSQVCVGYSGENAGCSSRIKNGLA
jgi:hypothetical protein